MPQALSDLYANGALLVMWGALVFHYILPIPKAAHPARIWHRFAQLLADKVNRNHSYQQSLISGALAWLLMIVPLWLLLWAFKPLAWQPQFFDLAILLLAFGWRDSETLAKQMVKWLSHQNKAKAREELAFFLNRETAPLSQLGLGKAGAETLLVGFSRNVIGVLFWYGIAGASGALIYRFSAELARAWSPARASHSPFGLTAVRIQAILDFVPLRLFALLLGAGNNGLTHLRLMRQQALSWPLPGPGWVLAVTGNKLGLSLGGPAIYEGRKQVRAKLGGRIAPAAFHLAQIQHLLAWRTCVWLLIQSALMALVFQGV